MNNPTRRHSPASERNRGPILAQLQRVLPERCTVLEVASGTGQHAAHFGQQQPHWQWWPTDADAQALPGISAWCEGLPNVHPPQTLDVMAATWPGVPPQVDAVYCANMLHISPWSTCAALMQGAARHLAPQGLLLLYGPYVIDGEPTAPSNQAFDADLRARHPAWGLRLLSAVLQEAQAAGLRLRERTPMPSNNQLLVLERQP
jgi:SAM-dependent methyltransferase